MLKKSKKNKRIFIIMLILMLLILAIGYAALSDKLIIIGTANAKGTFDLEFQNEEVVKVVGANEEETTAKISQDGNTLTVNVADLAYPGAGVEFSVDIVNVGTIPAEVQAVNAEKLTDSEHIKIKGLDVITTEHSTIAAGDTCNIHFTVEWPEELATEIAENEIATFELSIEYTQSTGEAFDGKPSHEDIVSGEDVGEPIPNEKMLVSQITGADYGKAINYVATVQGQEVSNWRVFFNDGKNVYIILSDYLESRLIPNISELNIINQSSVSSTDRETLLVGLKTESYWSEFANGVEGAKAIGSPIVQMLINSYNEKHGTELECTQDEKQQYVGSDDLYAIGWVNGNSGYWTVSKSLINDNNLWYVNYNGIVETASYTYSAHGIRPVVCLPSTLEGTVGETSVEI